MITFRRREENTAPLTQQDFHELATYNSEIGRGLAHTDAWKAKMAVLQERWNRYHYPEGHQ